MGEVRNGTGLSPAWTVSLPRSERYAVGFLRLSAGIEVLETGDSTWLRGPLLDDSLELDLRKLPGATRYRVLEDGHLLQVGSRIPSGTLPEGEWMPLDRWMRPELPGAAFPGEPSRRIALRLVRSAEEREARVLVCDLESWVECASAAPDVRLEGLEFAVAEDGRVLVRVVRENAPLPSLPGDRYVEAAGVAWPCGTTWDAPAAGEILRELLDLEEGDVALFSEGGRCEIVRAEDFVRASRSAARLSLEEARRA
jgi:hypothetical protein